MKQLGLSNFVLDLSRCWLWQYDQAPNLNGIMRNQEVFFKEYLQNFLVSFVSNIFNLNTANDFGLNIWRKILSAEKLDASFVCQNLCFEATDEAGVYNFCFASPDNTFHYIWSDNKQFRTSDTVIDDLDLVLVSIRDVIYRRYLISRLMIYYMRGTLPEIQNYLTWLYPEAGAVVTSDNDMTYKYEFTAPLNVEEQALFDLQTLHGGILPEICGVQSNDRVFDGRRFAFWDKTSEEKPSPIFPDNTAEAIENNYPYTYIEGDGEIGDNDGHGTSF